MKRKGRPSLQQSLALINACAGRAIVRGKDCVEVTEDHIDFELKRTEKNPHPLNTALALFWRTIGSQNRSLRPHDAGVQCLYEWDFTPPAGKLSLIYTADQRALVRLTNQVIERRKQ